MNIFAWLKKKPSTELVVAEPVYDKIYEIRDDRYKDYQVEYFPYSQKYFGKHKGRYLRKAYGSGIVEYAYSNDLLYAESFHSESFAWHLIDQHIEQKTRDTVKVIRR